MVIFRLFNNSYVFDVTSNEVLKLEVLAEVEKENFEICATYSSIFSIYNVVISQWPLPPLAGAVD